MASARPLQSPRKYSPSAAFRHPADSLIWGYGTGLCSAFVGLVSCWGCASNLRCWPMRAIALDRRAWRQSRNFSQRTFRGPTALVYKKLRRNARSIGLWRSKKMRARG